MKTYIVIILGLILCSCGNKSKSIANQNEGQRGFSNKVENISTKIDQPDISDFRNKVFEMGSETHFTDTCSFYFECDCCMGELFFDSDSTFFYFDYCMADQTVSKGTYEIADKTLILNYGSAYVTREYNYENELDTSAVDFFISGTLVDSVSITYEILECNNKILLSDQLDKEKAIEAKYDFGDIIEGLKKEGYLEKLEALSLKANHNNQ